jgi:hypothetical protein
MKHAAHKLQIQLATDIQNNLSGLTRSYAKKLKKPLMNMVRKLSRKFSRLIDKDRKDKHRKVSKEAATYLATWLQEAFGAGAAGVPPRKPKKLGLA